MDKQLFDDAIGEVPPSTVNVEASIVRGRRAARLRSVANPVAAAGVAVVLLAGAVAFTMTRGDGDEGVRVGGQPGTSSASPSTTTPSTTTRSPGEGKLDGVQLPEACSRSDLESGAEVIARLNPVVNAAFHAQRPDAQLVANSAAEYPHGVQQPPLEFYQVTGAKPTDWPICHVDTYFMSWATTKTPQGDGNVLVVVQPVYSGTHGTTLTCERPVAEQTFCEKVTGPRGDIILKTTLAQEGGSTMNRVDIARPDGTSVMVSSEDIANTGKSGGAVTASAVPLTLDQLVAIGTDPGMTLFP
jgi:hypothetical protein